jgi:hypothetical protein
MQFLTPFSMIRAQLGANLNVDDMDIFHLNMDQEESIFNVH